MEPALARELGQALRRAAEPVRQLAAARAPRGETGRLAGSLKTSYRGTSATVRSRLPYSNWIHWGGVISPKGTPIRIEGRPFIYDALQERREQIVDELAGAIDELARRHGWR